MYVLRHDHYGYLIEGEGYFAFNLNGNLTESGGLPETGRRIPNQAQRFKTKEEALDAEFWCKGYAEEMAQVKAVRVKEKKLPPTQENLERILNELPDDADAIALELKRRGIKAKCRSSHQCAISEYLRRRLDLKEHHRVQTTSEGNCHVYDHEHGHKILASANTNPVRSVFVRKFDEGQYPAIALP
jgi:hypothetical protein